MALTAEQLRIAAGIDAKMQEIARGGRDDMTIFAAMAGYMPDFKRLMDSAKPGDMDELGRKFTGFYRYAKILETIAAGIQSGAIKAPR
jgi:hypothetical protein